MNVMNDRVVMRAVATERAAFAPASWLRWLGALTFIGAGASFLVEGWTDPSIVKRQGLWALGTLIMTVLGIAVARRLRDARGARVFLGLAAATMAAHFAQLGSASYDLYSGGAGKAITVAIAGSIVLLLLPPLALGMAALMRRRARTLTSLMFLFSAPLVIPSRDPAAIACIAGALVALWLGLEATLFRSDPLFDSIEGVASRGMLLAPCVILLVRNGFHGTADIWLASVMASPAVVLLAWPRLRLRAGAFGVSLQIIGVSGLVAAVLVLGPPLLPLVLALSAVLLVASEFVHTRPVFLAWLGLCVFIGAAVIAYIEHGWPASLAITPLGTLHALAAFQRRNAWLFGAAVLATFAGTLAHLAQLVVVPKHDVWIAGAALSVALLALASLLESRKQAIQRISARVHQHFSYPRVSCPPPTAAATTPPSP